MNSKTFATIKVGDIITLTQDKTILSSSGISISLAGTQQVVTKVRHDNNEIYIQPEGHEQLYIRNTDLQESNKNQSKQKPAKFSQKEIETFVREGANDRLKKELSTRVQATRDALTQAVKPEEFNKQMTIVREQLRQAALIRAAIKQ